jgi:hypothetical protein
MYESQYVAVSFSRTALNGVLYMERKISTLCRLGAPLSVRIHAVAHRADIPPHPPESRTRICLVNQLSTASRAIKHLPTFSFQSSGMGIKPSLQQYVHGILSLSSTDGPVRNDKSGRPSLFRNELMTSPRPCHVLDILARLWSSAHGLTHRRSAIA